MPKQITVWFLWHSALFSSPSSLPIRKMSFKYIYKETWTVRRFPLLICSLSRWWFMPWAGSFLSTLRQLCSVICGRPRQQEAALAARSQSRLSGAGQRKTMQDRGCLYGFSQVQECSAWRKAGLWAPQWHQFRGDAKHHGLEFPRF